MGTFHSTATSKTFKSSKVSQSTLRTSLFQVVNKVEHIKQRVKMKTLWHTIILTWMISFWSGFTYGDHNGIEPFQEVLPIQCGDTEHLVEGLREEFDEEMIMMAAGKTAAGDDLFHSLWINVDKTSWTLVAVNKQKGVSCVIASGDNARMMVPAGI